VPPAPPELPHRRRLTRSAHDRWLGGVAGGTAEYLNADSTLVRVVFVLAALLSGGLAIPLYLAAWIVMPVDASGAGHERGPGAGPVLGVVFGLLLIGIGAIWLLNELDVRVPRWDVVLAVSLIAIGLATVASAGRRGAGGLVVLGIFVTLALASISAVDVSVDGAFGDRDVNPQSAAALEDSYSHAFGSMTVDLTDVSFARGTTHLDVSIAFGDLRVLVPDDIGLRVEGSTVFGSLRVLGREWSGFTNETWESDNYDGATRRLDLKLSTAFGSARLDARP
jgi:phage shock protein PspC (stress-responsive transcriptional regulator)